MRLDIFSTLKVLHIKILLLVFIIFLLKRKHQKILVCFYIFYDASLGILFIYRFKV